MAAKSPFKLAIKRIELDARRMFQPATLSSWKQAPPHEWKQVPPANGLGLAPVR
jgi:hypothetical protein